jgi:Uma2 family endonuclease
MSAAPKPTPIAAEDYLAGELISPIKHEYLGGVVHAMVGARNQHNLIKGNVHGRLHFFLLGKPCRPWDSDTKIRIRLPRHVRFYYPDVSVICRPNPPDDSFQDEPVVIVEVLSKKTHRIDTGEKYDAYLTIPTLSVYLLVESDSPLVVAHRRTEAGFVREVYEGLEAVVPLGEIDVRLPLAEIYDGVIFTPEPDEEM